MCEPIDDLPRPEFVRRMANTLGGDEAWCDSILESFLDGEGMAYGEEGHDWCPQAAHDLAMELNYA